MSEPDQRGGGHLRGSDRWGPKRRQFVKTTAGVTAGLSVAGCLDISTQIVGSGRSEGPVKIGLLAPEPGSDLIGRSMVRAARLAVDELNEEGGIDGRDAELVVGNTRSSPMEARRQYQRLILDEGVDVTAGIFSSEVLMNVLDDIAEQETIHLTSGAATSEASRRVKEEYDRYKYHFRVGPNNDVDLGRIQMDFLEDMAPELGWGSIALLAEDYEWTEGPWGVYQERIARTGVDVVLEERYPPAIDDFSSRYDEAEAAGADAVFITTAHTGVDALLDWVLPSPYSFGFAGIHVPMQLPVFYEETDGACRYAIGQNSATANSSITDKTQGFVQAYQDAYNGSKPVYTGYHTFDAIKVFAHVVESNGTLDHEELVPALESVSFTGSGGTVEFYGRDADYPHDFIYKRGETVYFQWQENDDGEGVQEVIWPEEQETADYVSPPWIEQ